MGAVCLCSSQVEPDVVSPYKADVSVDEYTFNVHSKDSVCSTEEEAALTYHLSVCVDGAGCGAFPMDGIPTPPTPTSIGSRKFSYEDFEQSDDAEQSGPMGPIGSGGMPCSSAEMTEDQTRLKKETIQLFEQHTHSKMTSFNLDYLTPMTLQNYISPIYAPDLLMKSLEHRAAMEDKLEGRVGIRLNGSCRIVGWDAQGRTIIAHEPCTMLAPLSEFLDHFEYVMWNAMDLNKPGANGVVVVLDVAGGCNWRHYLSMHASLEAVKLLKNCFHGRLAALFMVDMPSTFQKIFNTVAKFAEEDTRQRIKTVSGTEALIQELSGLGADSDTMDYFRKHMGQQRNAKAEQSWFPLADTPFFREKLGDLGLTTKTEQITHVHHTKFRDAMQQLMLQKWGC